MRLKGREAETGRIDSLLDGARVGRSGALLVRGRPGAGKTALLHYAMQRAQGMTVLLARGLEAEAGLAFAALADVLRPVLGRLDAIPGPQSAALAAALGLGPAVPEDRFLVCAATLSLLTATAQDRPVLAAVDDAQWIDAPSRETILYAARRLDGGRVAMLIATRARERTIATDLEELTLVGRDVGADANGSIGALTEHELRLSMIVARGATNKETSATLCISPKTVEAHLHRIYVKLGIRSRTELARELARAQLLSD